eukprot:Sspe_Gene.393::Locus_139_Transcript_1_1_Confidence_1.000_Length_3527::g.393::m.393
MGLTTPLARSSLKTLLIVSPNSSKLRGTCTPASAIALFFASAVSRRDLARAPAWPNCTSYEKHFAHVPTHQATKGLRQPPILDGLAHVVLIRPSNLTQQDHHLHIGVLLVPQQHVDEACTGVPVPTDRKPLGHTVAVPRQNVVELV